MSAPIDSVLPYLGPVSGRIFKFLPGLMSGGVDLVAVYNRTRSRAETIAE